MVDVKEVRHPLARATGTPGDPRPQACPPWRSTAAASRPSPCPSTRRRPPRSSSSRSSRGRARRHGRRRPSCVHYVALDLAGGKQFDSSWDRGQSASFPIGTGKVLPGWDEGLVGQAVGSQVLLVVPPDKGYGSAGEPEAGITGTDTLVFVVDILDAL